MLIPLLIGAALGALASYAFTPHALTLAFLVFVVRGVFVVWAGEQTARLIHWLA
jgi:uncharacterized membrane protein YfcA